MSEKAKYLSVREFHDGTYSVAVRIYNPQKKFYEHPTFINLSKDIAQKKCDELIKNPPTIQEVLVNWEYIGD